MRNYTLGFTLNVLLLPGIFIYISIAATADGSAGGVCEQVDCVKGKCVETGEFLGIGFKCVCDPGTLDFGCESRTPLPQPSPPSSPFNITDRVFGADCKGVALDPPPTPPPSPGDDGPCKYVDCGKGKCVETGELFGIGFECICDPGWTQIQLGPITYPACNVPNCVFGADCKGVELSGNQPTLPSPPPPGDGSSGVPNCSSRLRAWSVLLLFTMFPI
ncbi:hypothetical protein HAX54_051434 [Datura stramonium]|uniref:EGF-like domain-containing protein n=1 Tax=Datura stramonium TaxID=4076 RepID=A0ABS8WMG7_DATST|nr:hypothetical protein [Datura stramonium]